MVLFFHPFFEVGSTSLDPAARASTTGNKDSITLLPHSFQSFNLLSIFVMFGDIFILYYPTELDYRKYIRLSIIKGYYITCIENYNNLFFVTHRDR